MKLARPVAAAFRLARVEQDQVLAQLGRRVVAIGGVQIADLVRRVLVRARSGRATDVRDRRRRRATQFDARRAEEGHREVAAQVDAVRVEADVHREALDEVLAVVAVVERAGAEEEGDGGVDGGLRRGRPR